MEDGAGAGSESDFGLTTGGHSGDVALRYERLCGALGMATAVVVRQVHGVRVLEADSTRDRGARVIGEGDGLVTSERGMLLAVTAADCVPVFVADTSGRCVALLHAGWRGTAGGILEAGLSFLERRYGARSGDVAIYLGPAICGSCYEVGGDVLRAFAMDGSDQTRFDLRAELARRAQVAGVSPERVRRSEWCTRCGPVNLYSHRAQGAGAGRMAAFLGLVGAPPV